MAAQFHLQTSHTWVSPVQFLQNFGGLKSGNATIKSELGETG